MDIEFIVQDTFVLTRPQWKLATNLEEAAKAFHLAISQDQKSSGIDRAADQDDASTRSSSDDDGIEGDGELGDPEAESDRDSDLPGDDEDGEADDDGEVRLLRDYCGSIRFLTNCHSTRMTSMVSLDLIKIRIRKKKQLWSRRKPKSLIRRLRPNLTVNLQK